MIYICINASSTDTNTKEIIRASSPPQHPRPPPVSTRRRSQNTGLATPSSYTPVPPLQRDASSSAIHQALSPRRQQHTKSSLPVSASSLISTSEWSFFSERCQQNSPGNKVSSPPFTQQQQASNTKLPLHPAALARLRAAKLMQGIGNQPRELVDLPPDALWHVLNTVHSLASSEEKGASSSTDEAEHSGSLQTDSSQQSPNHAQSSYALFFIFHFLYFADELNEKIMNFKL